MLTRAFCSGISDLFAVPAATTSLAVRRARGASSAIATISSASISTRSHCCSSLVARISTRRSSEKRQASFANPLRTSSSKNLRKKSRSKTAPSSAPARMRMRTTLYGNSACPPARCIFFFTSSSTAMRISATSGDSPIACAVAPKGASNTVLPSLSIISDIFMRATSHLPLATNPSSVAASTISRAIGAAVVPP